MICQSFLFAIIAILEIASGLLVKEKITPVDIKYYCVKVTEADVKVPNKAQILLIHDLGGNHKEWDGTNLHLSFRTKRRVCSVDLRNHGDSPWNKRNDVKVLAADVGRFLDKQGLKKINIIGHGLGGKVAVHYAVNNPTRVNSIVVEDMRPNGIVKGFYNQKIKFFTLLKEALTKVPSKVSEAKARDIILNSLNKKQLGSTKNFTKESIRFLELKLLNGKWNFKQNMDVIVKSMKELNTFLSKTSGVYKGPALFIYGTESSIKVGDDKTNILKMFPKSRLIPVKGAKHTIHGKFRNFEDEVIKFLNATN